MVSLLDYYESDAWFVTFFQFYTCLSYRAELVLQYLQVGRKIGVIEEGKRRKRWSGKETREEWG